MALVFHRLITLVPISELRKHHVVSSILTKHKARMTVHMWTEDDVHISTFGFFVSMDPSNCLKDEFKERVKMAITAATQRNLKNIPKFQCGFSLPFNFTKNNIKVATKTFDLQCRQSNAKELFGLLQPTYVTNPCFIFHKLRHMNHDSYSNVIHRQNAFLSHTRTVPRCFSVWRLIFSRLKVFGLFGITRTALLKGVIVLSPPRKSLSKLFSSSRKILMG